MVNPYSGPRSGETGVFTDTSVAFNPSIHGGQGGGGTGGGGSDYYDISKSGQGIADPRIVNQRRGEAGNTGAGNQWQGWDFANQGGGGLAGLSNQASGGQGMQSMAMAPQGLPAAPGMATAGLNSLATKAKKPPRRTLAQTYRT
jgi:hypothetical protein